MQFYNGIRYMPVMPPCMYMQAQEMPGTIEDNTQLYNGRNKVSDAYRHDDEIIPKVFQEVVPSVVFIDGKAGSGSGIIVKPDGHILTNAHVVEDNKSLMVHLWNEEAYEAEVKCLDTFSDLALIKINKTGLKAANIGSQEDIVCGKTVLAIGSPESFRNSVSIGIISGTNRVLGKPYRLIQTDSAINHGNSGGPLVNLKSEVIGINTLGIDKSIAEGLNFAIPVDTIKYVIEHFYKYGRVKRPSLGVLLMESNELSISFKRADPENKGVVIFTVNDGSCAQKAGLKPYDTIYSIDKFDINSPVDFNECMKKYSPGDTVILKVRREEKITSLNAVLDEFGYTPKKIASTLEIVLQQA